MEAKEKEALGNFLLDIDCLNELNPWIDSQNIFEILKMSSMEIRHSNFLAWLLNANEGHSFGDNILKDIVCKLIIDNKDFCEEKGLDIIRASLLDYNSFNIYREREHIDILLVSDKERIVICFENKVFSSEHDNQLERYLNKIEEKYKNYLTLYIYLTPFGEEASIVDWLSLSYDEIIGIIEKNKEKIQLTVEEKVFIDNYINIVRRHIMKDEELMKICSDIYLKHKQALDLIYDNLPDSSYGLFEVLCNECEKLNDDGKIIFVKSESTKSYIRFNTKFMLDILPELSENRKSSWGTKHSWYYEIINKAGKLKLQFVSSSKGLKNEEIIHYKEVFQKMSNRNTKDNWQWKAICLAENLLPDDSLIEDESVGSLALCNALNAVKIFEAQIKL